MNLPFSSKAVLIPPMNPILETRSYIESLVANGGPSDTAESEFIHFLAQLSELFSRASPSKEWLSNFRSWFGPALSPATMQGFALSKPHGYAGDFEIIDMFYREHISPDPMLANWDRFIQRSAGAKAVRNRKNYFHDLLNQHAARQCPLRVLNVASGPGRCIFEWLSTHPEARVSIDCVELDAKAIAFAEELNRSHLDRIAFTRANALSYQPRQSYDFIWAAGLFDYFDDAIFTRMLVNLAPSLATGGELVVGNFSDSHSSRCYMEILSDWHLHHRSSEKLSKLARDAGIPSERIRIGSEPEGVNLFLHIMAEPNIKQ